MNQETGNINTTGHEINDSYQMVEGDEALNALCRQWQERDFLAMDTEFIRTSTFYPQVGLIQVNAGSLENYLIDPLTISDWTLFSELMRDEGIIKIFHSCSEDLQVFMASMNLVPYPVFDTQIAAALLDEGFGMSYQNLVKVLLDIELPKGETRSDWLQRPLDERQLHYAALDVACLPLIYKAQENALATQGRLSWHAEECRLLIEIYEREMTGNFSDYYLNMRGAWQLSSRQLGLLKQLAEWRENRARDRDKPRNWIIRDKSLMEIARQFPEDLNQLGRIEEISRNFLRHEGQQVLDMVQEAREIPEDALPLELPRPLDGRSKNRLKRGQGFVEAKAAELGLPMEMLSRKRWLVELLQSMLETERSSGAENTGSIVVPTEFSGWRHALLFPGLTEAMK